MENLVLLNNFTNYSNWKEIRIFHVWKNKEGQRLKQVQLARLCWIVFETMKDKIEPTCLVPTLKQYMSFVKGKNYTYIPGWVNLNFSRGVVFWYFSRKI